MSRATIFHKVIDKKTHGRDPNNVITQMLTDNNLTWPTWSDSFTVSVIRDVHTGIAMHLLCSKVGFRDMAYSVSIAPNSSIGLLKVKLYALYKTAERNLVKRKELA